MADLNEAGGLWLAKTSGAIAGSAISIAYFLPAGRREAAIRFAVGVACGLVFGSTAGIKIATELGCSRVSRAVRDGADGIGDREPVRVERHRDSGADARSAGKGRFRKDIKGIVLRRAGRSGAEN